MAAPGSFKAPGHLSAHPVRSNTGIWLWAVSI